MSKDADYKRMKGALNNAVQLIEHYELSGEEARSILETYEWITGDSAPLDRYNVRQASYGLCE